MVALGRMKNLVRLLCLASVVSIGACDDHSHEATGRAACDAIVERCHLLDLGTGAIHECHEFAEATTTTNDQCVARQAMCFATCTAPSDAGSDASTDASTDAATGG